MNPEFLAVGILGGGLVGAIGRATVLWRQLSSDSSSNFATNLQGKVDDLQAEIRQQSETFSGIVSDARARARIKLKGLERDLAVVNEDDPARKRQLLFKRALLRGAAEGFTAGVLACGTIESLVIAAQTFMPR